MPSLVVNVVIENAQENVILTYNSIGDYVCAVEKTLQNNPNYDFSNEFAYAVMQDGEYRLLDENGDFV